jgi:MFS family permease
VVTALDEWRRHPMLPVAGAMGYATGSMFIYGLGPYIQPLTRQFGWSVTQVTIGLTIATLSQAIASIPIGMAVDRFGSRRFALVGVLIVPAGFALLGTATGSHANWYFLWGIMALLALSVQSTVWSSAVAARFAVSRGMALALALCGGSLSAAALPWLGTTLIEAYSWRSAFAFEAAIFCAIVAPIIFVFFHGTSDKSQAGARESNSATRVDSHGVGFVEGLRSTIYLRLVLASLLYTFTAMALIVLFVPLLTSSGIVKLEAAKIAGLIGVVSIVGRIATGFLIDRYRGSMVGAGALLLPALGCFALLTTHSSVPGALIAAVLIGGALGAEVDVIVYLTARHFGLKSFGALYGGTLIALAVGSSIGPLVAARIFDVYRTYTPFLWLTVICTSVGALALASLPQPGPVVTEGDGARPTP